MQAQGKPTLNSSKFVPFFNKQNSSHGMYYCEKFTESKFDVEYVNTEKSTIQQVHVFKSNRMFGTKHSKTNRF